MPAPSIKAYLPSAAQLQKLSEEKLRLLVQLANEDDSRATRYSIIGMICGTLSFLACLGIFFELVILNHEKAAGVVIGATVLAVISKMIQGRK